MISNKSLKKQKERLFESMLKEVKEQSLNPDKTSITFNLDKILESNPSLKSIPPFSCSFRDYSNLISIIFFSNGYLTKIVERKLIVSW